MRSASCCRKFQTKMTKGEEIMRRYSDTLHALAR
jgi:hypothetical protein